MMSLQYRQLDAAKQEIRLLCLLLSAEQSRDLISCELIHECLDNVRPYAALSYVWGSPLPSRDIQIDGQRVPVGENLYQAVLQLREKDESVLWIDAICINQSDNSEKTTQVQLMREIYSRAHGVIVWLGCGNPETDLAV